ncbi:MAG: Na+/H+ antiporter NhaA [Frankiales bacterium]|nr:MAG: Na+/H+ antiporter NhaA [Frankiales bacterium]
MTAVTSRLLPRADITAAARDYLRTEAGGAVLLLLATVAALVWANSPWSDSYTSLWDTHLSVQLGGSVIDESLRHWVNDGLMTLFFLLVGLEIARELSVGEYQDRRAVVAPALAALGGLVVPAALYLAIAGVDGAEAAGWGIAISTDTAFALGVLALVGPRCPNRLRIFLLALAIVDDVAAIGVIALFYTDDLDLGALAVAGLLFLALVALRTARVSNPAPYGVVAVLLWLATYASGVHPTVAGVAMGLLFASYAPSAADLERAEMAGRSFLSAPSAERAREAMLSLRTSVAANDRLTLRLHPVVSFAVVPLFALANAGVPLGGGALREAATSRVAIGIVVGLVVGKLLGVVAGTWCALRLPAARFVGGVRWGQVTGVASVAGIGFTIALFVTDLAFDDPALQQDAKIGILAGSLLAALVSLGVFRFLSARGGLCLPGDAPRELPALSAIPDPD